MCKDIFILIKLCYVYISYANIISYIRIVTLHFLVYFFFLYICRLYVVLHYKRILDVLNGAIKCNFKFEYLIYMLIEK